MAKTILLIPAFQPEKAILKLLEALMCSRDLSAPVRRRELSAPECSQDPSAPERRQDSSAPERRWELSAPECSQDPSAPERRQDSSAPERRRELSASERRQDPPVPGRRWESGRTGEPGIDSIIVVDDGSGDPYREVFEAAQKMGCQVIRHEKNKGKGAAIRTGIQAAVDLYGPDVHVVTADADGQHLPADILRVAAVLQEENALQREPVQEENARQRESVQEENLPQKNLLAEKESLPRSKKPAQEENTSRRRRVPEKNAQSEKPVLVLGVREFSGKDVPFRSRWGNRITAAIFRLSTGTSCGDTQTGLRGIPAALLPLALSTEGDRYEYEMQFLLEAVRQADLRQVPIETVYEEGNRTSHFRPVRDSLLIYRRPLRFFLTAAVSAVVDWSLFLLLIRLFGSSAFSAHRISVAEDAAAASALSRIGSGAVNFALNRKWSFQSKGKIGPEMLRYLVLFLANLLCNASAVAGLTLAGVPAALGKFVVDVVLFLVNYQVQKRWVFSE